MKSRGGATTFPKPLPLGDKTSANQPTLATIGKPSRRIHAQAFRSLSRSGRRLGRDFTGRTGGWEVREARIWGFETDGVERRLRVVVRRRAARANKTSRTSRPPVLPVEFRAVTGRGQRIRGGLAA